MAKQKPKGEVDDNETSTSGGRADGSAPTWVRWGCTALLLVGSAGLALYMFAS